ncbi:flavin monoamine oxidase family protein [Gottfriedia luciferensis]|uniref:flavin monoamine oxidase family protein n=1 Tax=Gottfriedia luciferensis TaxID=178774 RepID=UPI000B43441D|nr:FAD-dependent oxidoreductase [Gottfriedia luciferensis]
MAHTPILRMLKRAATQAAKAYENDNREQTSYSRRQFLKGAAALSVAAAVPTFVWNFDSIKAQAAGSKVVIIGGGLAGLTCAYRLKERGVVATIYEAMNRVGGRCWTRRNYFADNQISENGGELIDTGHKAIRKLAKELGLTFDNLLAAEESGSVPFFYFSGKPYTFDQATYDMQSIMPQLNKDSKDAGYPTTYNQYTVRGKQLDNMSITDWIESYVPGGLNSNLGKLLDVAYTIEYGVESSEQSSLNLIYLLGGTDQSELETFGESDEKYHIRGGNDQIVSLLENNLNPQINLGYKLKKIVKNLDGTYTLSFSDKPDVIADIVVMTIPFSILRSDVDFYSAGFRPMKVKAINELGMGTNAKLLAQFSDRHWQKLGNNGLTYSDTGYQNTWEVTRAQDGKSGILVKYTGGKIGDSLNQGSLSSQTNKFLNQIEPVLPGISKKWNGISSIVYWPGMSWTKGSYSYFKKGQYTSFSGIEGEPEGNVFFAGEHCSQDYQGYLNGAVDTGEEAATEVLKALKATVTN